MSARYVALAVLILVAACSYEEPTPTDAPVDNVDVVDDDFGDDDGDDAHPDDPACDDPGGAAPASTALTPTFPLEYYAEQSDKYFDTLDTYADPTSIPNYSEMVARWEWPPWLKLTGLGREPMIWIDRVLRLYPTEVVDRDCRGFDTQPFGRCRVVFHYQGGPGCPIYEEFTFNDAGEVTFIEAWSDLPAFLPMPDLADAWGEGAGVLRLSTKVPGLGRPDGRVDLFGECLEQVAATDADVADFRGHARAPMASWIFDYLATGADSFEVGCGWY